MIDALASLNFIWDFLKPLATDVFKEHLKPKGSAQIAKARVLDLYSSLQEMQKSVDAFIGAFGRYALRENDGFEIDVLEIHRRSVEAENQAQAVIKKLANVVHAMEAVDPQLGIYKPEIVELLTGFGILESYTVERARVFPSNDEMQKALQQAEENQRLLSGAIESLRKFILQEFAFKEAF